MPVIAMALATFQTETQRRFAIEIVITLPPVNLGLTTGTLRYWVIKFLFSLISLLVKMPDYLVSNSVIPCTRITKTNPEDYPERYLKRYL